MKHLNKLVAMSLLLAGSLSAAAINVTFHVDYPDAVSMSSNGIATTLAAGNTTLNLNEYDYLSFSGIQPYVITGVTNASGTPESIYSGVWYKSIYPTDEGQVYNISVKNLDEARTASCSVSVDDPSRVNAVLSGTYTTLTLQEGNNTVRFDPEVETTLMLSSSDYQKPLYRVTLDGVDVPSQGGTFNVPLTQGCNVDITAKIPEAPVTVAFSYSEEGMGAISRVAVDGVNYAEFDGATVSMMAGQSLTLTPNSAYNITGLQINGVSQAWTGGYDYTINGIVEDMQVYVEAHPYSTISVTLNVTDPEQITVYRGYSHNNDVITLSGTANVIELPENNTLLSWSVANGCYIESVKVGGETFSGDYVTCTDGMVIDIVTKAIVMDKAAVVWIDDRSAVDTYFSFETATREQIGSAFTTGYNIVDFYDGYNPFGMSWYSQNETVGKVYVNDVLQSPMYAGSTTYQLSLADRDVVKLFYAAEPVDCTVTFSLGEGVTADVTRDIICDVADLDATLSCFAGTQINIAKADKSIDVKVNGEALTALEGGENYQFVVTASETNVEISARGTEGIDGITTDSEVAAPVYNLQGVKVSETLEGLPVGIYITSGRKVVVK